MANKRPFAALSVVATGAQDPAARFGKRRRHEDAAAPPPLAQWRSNLTALSQEHNLYFVAYGPELHVFVPRFPAQILTAQPVLIVPSLPSQPDLAGYLDPREPHAINNLIVQRLGNDEVVATVRDDGDVDVVLVRHVLQAISRRAEKGNALGLVADELRPIFQSNVGISAWGLAIHTHARVLAISSNAHEVRVFKFGLLSDDDRPPDGREDGLPGNADAQSGEHRRMDVTQRVLNGAANIPAIAFCNTGDDPHARWLLTTDISGYCRVMDLRCTADRSPTAQQFRFGRSFPSYSGGMDRHNAGWCIMFLDRRSFQPTREFRDAVGIAEGETLPGLKGNGRAWDLSDTVEARAENSPAFTYNQRKAPRTGSGRRSGAGDGSRDSSQLLSPAAESPSSLPSTPRGPVEAAVAQSDSELLDVDAMHPESDPDSAQSPSDPSDDDNMVDLVTDAADPDDEGTEDTPSYSALYSGRRICGNQPYFYHQGGLCEDLPCPVLHASVKNLYLLQPSNQALHPGAFAPPVVGLANPLRQAVQQQFAYLNMFDRMNMSGYVPALGVVVLASQKGRAVVMALTKLAGSAGYPDEVRGSLGPAKTNYAMRVECVLPFASQEAGNQRPFAPLHGIAVGPIQGTEGLGEERKRWRLMMMYQDHSLLSYEIKRRRFGDAGVAVDSVVV
ncbi:hypothetical protein LTR53_007157 [Teratosphaeriaceae sp. CCFEE 6253]|nr:hypothetical protein LTR53_007157 [Teratosphaeriaceae sp. CCFEE 6253]